MHVGRLRSSSRPGSENAAYEIMLRALSALALVATCEPETTSFRTTDRSDGLDPPAAAYDLSWRGERIAHVRVWSEGGYIGNTDEPMTHIGFQIENKGSTVIRFDTSALQLIVVDKRGKALPKPVFTTVTPLGPELVSIWPGTTVTLDSYFTLYVQPMAVARMGVSWSLRYDGRRYNETTHFVRDDDKPVLEYRPQKLPQIPSS